MKITTRLLLSFLIVSIIPLGLMGYIELQAMRDIRSMATSESTAARRRGRHPPESCRRCPPGRALLRARNG
jgi:CHASE3 domain sensor protein